MHLGAEDKIAGTLDAGERLLWSGQPATGIRFRTADWYMIPFSLLWGGFAIFWEVMAFQDKAPLFFRFWGMPFVLVGLYLIAGRFIWDARRRARTSYAVTDRRLLLVSGSRSQVTTSLSLRTLPAITLAERADGSGDIVFDGTDARHVAVGGLVPRGSSVPTMFEFVPNARRVYDVIREAQLHAV